MGLAAHLHYVSSRGARGGGAALGPSVKA